MRPFLLPVFNQPVVFVGENSDGAESFGFIGRHEGVGDDDHHITDLYPTGGGAVEANHATAPFTTNGVGFEAFTVVVIHDLDLFPFVNIGGFEQLLVNGDTADIVQVGLRDLYPVYFAFKNFDQHRFDSSVGKTAHGRNWLQK
jgi:hypothetical protein